MSSVRYIVVAGRVLFFCMLLIPCQVSAVEPVPDLRNFRLFMSAAQRSDIERYSLDKSLNPEPLSVDLALDPVSKPETGPVAPVAAVRRTRKITLHGVVARSDGKVFAWVNNRSAETARRADPGRVGTQFNGTFDISDQGNRFVLRPGQSITVESVHEQE